MSRTIVRGALWMALLLGCSSEATENAAPVSGPSTASEAHGGDGTSSEPTTSGNDQDDQDAGTEGGDAAKPPPKDCSVRKGGALITLNVGGEDFVVWSTNAKFNSEAFLAAAQGTLVTPTFETLVDGVDCDGQWTWHVDAEALGFEDGYEQACDAPPSTVEANKATWLAKDRWCPSKVLVAAYQGYP